MSTQTVRRLAALQKCRVATYRPYIKQAIFHAAGKDHRERCLLAGNQLGKTLGAGNEVSYHTTGLYPDWWEGKRFSGPTQWWVSNTNNETVRDNPQRILMGRDKNWGMGTIPAGCLEEPTMARGFPNLVDTVAIRHVTGGFSQIQMKAYEQGRTKWQGATLTGGVWLDEEPDEEIYGEAVARLAPGSILLFTVTPLLGMSEVVRYFYPHPDNSDRHLTMMEIEDATATGPGVRGHYTPKEAAQRIAGYRPHEREARSKGIPLLGEGRVFPIAQSEIEEKAMDGVPSHWPQLNALDFGYKHFAAVSGAWDRDAKTLHITKTYLAMDKTPVVHVAAIKAWGEWLRNAWPHDGTQTQKGEGMALAEIYRKAGLKMLPTHATFHSGGYQVEPGIQEMWIMMETKRLRVAEHLSDWWAEFLAYHRKKGVIVKERDHLMDATRALIMCLRYARVETVRRQPTIVGMTYDPLGGP